MTYDLDTLIATYNYYKQNKESICTIANGSYDYDKNISFVENAQKQNDFYDAWLTTQQIEIDLGKLGNYILSEIFKEALENNDIIVTELTNEAIPSCKDFIEHYFVAKNKNDMEAWFSIDIESFRFLAGLIKEKKYYPIFEKHSSPFEKVKTYTGTKSFVSFSTLTKEELEKAIKALKPLALQMLEEFLQKESVGEE